MSKEIFDSLLTHTTARDAKKYLLMPLSIHNFFKQNDVRKIPDYQRPYSWAEENINDLLNDIQKISDGERESWFLGPLFTTKIDENDKESGLLDGQQRITTIQLILREASIISNRIEGLDLSENSDLENETKILQNKCLESIRFFNIDNKLSLKFRTENSIIELFKYYISNFENANFSNYAEKVAEFENKANLEARLGSKTAKNLLKARALISDYLTKNFILSDTIRGLEELNKFLQSLLHKCWIIEVPLFEEDSSIQIFESLNNRGKTLTLSDKLRYKCLINCENSEYREELKMLWKQIYKGLDNCVEKKFIKDDEDFFKVLFNTIKRKSISRQEQMMKLFEEKYLYAGSESDKDEGIKKFINDTLTIIHFYENIFAKNFSQNNFINQFENHEKEKVKALIQLVKNGTSFSDNSRFLLYAIVLKYYSIENFDNNYNLINDLWILVRIIFIKESLTSKKSNTIRNEMLEIVDDNHINWNLKKYFSSRIDTDFSINKSNLNDVLIQNDNKEASFIIYLYCYLMEYKSLIFANEEQYEKEHLEHFFARSWKENWSEKKFTKNQIKTFLEEELENNFDSLKVDENKRLYAINEINNKESLELSNHDSSQKNTLIQFIGNKWVIHSTENISASNLGFTDKKKYYESQLYIKLPKSQNSEVGFDSYQDFTYKEIITRSLTIINRIFENFYNQWQDVSE